MSAEVMRGWQFTQLENNIKTIHTWVSTLAPETITTYRDSGNGWTVLEVLCHLRDFEMVFFQRARITVEQDNGALPFPKPDELAAENHYNAQDLNAVLSEWKQHREGLVAYFRERPASDWDRTAVHPTRGLLSLAQQLCLATLHDTIHLEQMVRIMAEKRTS